RLHQAHAFSTAAALRVPGRTALIVGPALLLVPWALLKRRTPGVVYATWTALAGLLVSSVARGTDGAFRNAFIPAVYFGAVAIGVAAGRLVDDQRRSDVAERRGAIASLLLWASVVIGRGGLGV